MNIEKIIVGGGSHWTLEAIFKAMKGITKVESGKYHLGELKNKKDLVDVVTITFDSDTLALDTILQVFFSVHNPNITQWGDDCMFPLYRSCVFAYTSSQHSIIANFLLKTENDRQEKIETKLFKANDSRFTVTEKKYLNYYHQYPTDAFSVSNIEPKLQYARENFRTLFHPFIMKDKSDIS